MRYFISLSYKGTSYCGWQIQVNQPSVQGELERAFSIYLGEKIGITGAGRTDAGVHALNYIAHFDSVNPILIQDYPKLIYKINAILPSDITLLNICHVADNSHARFDAVSRTYKYFIHTKKDPFVADYSYFFPYTIDIERMNEASKYFFGEQDFTSLAKLHSDNKTNICNVTGAIFELCGEPYKICFTVTSNRFLRNMARAMVGSILEVGRGEKPIEWIPEMLMEKNRSKAGTSVPAHALFLTEIKYPYNLFDKF